MLGLMISLGGLPSASGLTIVRDFIGGEQGHSDTGTGNLHDIFHAAADIWESIILDDHVVTLHYGWADNGGGEHFLNAQGGTPNRETEGTILFNNDDVVGHHHYYLDPTPHRSEEYPVYLQVFQDMGGGTVNVTRLYGDGTGVAGLEDLLSIALHEIGHALGMSLANSSFIAECTDGSIAVTSPRPFVGSLIPMASNASGVTSHIDSDVAGRLLMGGHGPGERVFPTTLDILALAQLSQFEKLNLDLLPPLTIARSGPEVVVAWQPLIPATVLQASDDLGATSAWIPAAYPALSDGNGWSVHFTPAKPAEFFRLATNDSVPRTISTSQNATDANPPLAGIQISAGSTVTYSGSVMALVGESLNWRWYYTVDGGPWNIAGSGSGSPVASVPFTYDATAVGKTYVWTLDVFQANGNGVGSSRTVSKVVAGP
jgi:hypothetical protein